ncbi:MAG: SoxR reducing system RseC family protein [Christensenellales bacterium]|jgi:positive regulator of sigma E activity|nr:SoxR reducing system RseC family protein [Eubacteriales bacterium]
MREIGTVTKIKRDYAVVAFDRRSACDKCRMCAVTKGGAKVEVTVKNTLGKGVGDAVAVEMGDKFVLTAAAVVYIIPLLLVAAGLLIGKIKGETLQMILASAGFVLGFLIAAVVDKLLRRIKGFVPAMVEDLRPTADAPEAAAEDDSEE